jgi:hypothetical protein
VSYFVVRAAETWTFGSIVGAVLLLLVLVAIVAFLVTRGR